MKIQRTIPPTAAPIYLNDIFDGCLGFIRGQRTISRFESEIKKFFDVKHCFLLSSGKTALTIILKALKQMHPDRDEVLIPAYNCYSVPSAIIRAGLKIRLCDINPDTLDFDFNQLSEMVSPTQSNKLKADCDKRGASNRLLAVVPTHFFGISSDVKKVREIIRDPHITIIEDAAQTLGCESKGKKHGTSGDIGFYSLGRGKTFSTVEGGIIVTDLDEVAQAIESRIDHLSDYSPVELIRLFLNAVSLFIFLSPVLFWFPKSLPFLKLGETIFDPNFKMRKMSSFQAGLAKRWQKKLQRFKTVRQKISHFWHGTLMSKCIDNYELSAICPELNLNLLRFPVMVKNPSLKHEILDESQRSGLGIMPTYPDTIDGIDQLKTEFKDQHFPSGKKIVEELITLPTHHFISRKDRDKIIALLLKYA